MRRITDLPTPAGHWLLGQALQFRPSSLHQRFERWAQELGAIFRVRFLNRRMLVVADHALLGDILRQRPAVWMRNPITRTISREIGLPVGLFSAEGEAWKVQRRMVMAAFSPENVRRYYPQMAMVTQRLQARWHKAALEGRELPLQPELMRYTVDTIAGLALGADINTLGAGEDVIQQHLDQVLPAILSRALRLIPTWRFYKSASDRALDQAVTAINREIERFMARAREELQDQPALRNQPRNLLQALLLAAEQESNLGADDVRGNVLTMLLAGEDTTANTLAWALELLHRHPEALQRCREEADAALAETQGDAGRITPAMLDALPWLEACIHETMRLKPVAPFLSLQALQNTQVGDVAVPQGTVMWAVFRHDTQSETFFEEPAAFKPQRWLGEVPGSAKRVAMPFGAGPRICPGRYLALLEMKLALSMFVTCFDIESLRTADGSPARERLYFTMAPEDLYLRLKPRAGPGAPAKAQAA
jgi:cytochrome P450